ncbi:MAG: methyltransferase domain-containing protein [Phycisphaerales bacterium]|nr:MAG: methyltransferase domain-containing protein [Phycisphaerales bacterium]
MNWDAFFLLHSDLPREGPGSDEATLQALDRLPPLRPCPRVLDLGCGPGRHTLVLARHLRTPIIAIDPHEPFLDQLRRRATAEGLDELVVALPGRMETLNEQPGTVDLIWCEGAAYIVGFTEALSLWRPLLGDDGLVVVTEATWLTDSLPAEVRDFWQQEYPAITTIDENIARAATAGFAVFDHFTLPPSAWWDEYYDPLIERMAALRPRAAGDAALAQVIAEHEREIDMHRRFGHTYGYVFYLMRKA